MSVCDRRCFLLTTGALAASAASESAATPRRRVGSFLVTAPGGDPDRLARVLEAASLEELEAEMGRVLDVSPPAEQIRAIVYPSRGAHRAAVARLSGGAPHRRALYVQDRGAAVILAYQHDELALDLRHEGAHALLHADLPMVPLWLDEGLASYFQEPSGLRAAGGSHHRPLINDLRKGRMVSVAELENRKGLRELSLRDYRFAWGWVHYLLHGPRPATEALWRTLSDIRRRQPPRPLSALLADVAPQPEAALRRHLLAEWPRRLADARTKRRG